MYLMGSPNNCVHAFSGVLHVDRLLYWGWWLKTKTNFLFSLGSNRNHWLCTNHDSHRWIAPICGCNSDPHLRSWGKLHSHDWIERVLDKVSLWLGQWSKSRSCFKANHGICELKIWGRELLIWESFVSLTRARNVARILTWIFPIINISFDHYRLDAVVQMELRIISPMASQCL